MAGTDARHDRTGGTGYEKQDISVRGAGLLTLGILLTLPVVALLVHLFFDALADRERRAQPPRRSEIALEADALPPEPRLQMTPVADYARVRGEEDRALATYGWADRSTGKVRIPVARAIDLLVERGLPGPPASPGAEAAR